VYSGAPRAHYVPRVLIELWQSARSLARAPGLALALLFTIAIGIGSTAVIQGFVRGLATRGSPLVGSEGLVSLFARDAQGLARPFTYEEYATLKERAEGFEWIGAARVSQTAGELTTAAVTPELARLLDLRLDEGSVISHRRARRGEQGRVAPEWLDGLYLGRAIDLWTPLRDPGGRNYWAIGQLRRGAAPSPIEGVSVLPYTGMTPETADGVTRVTAALSLAAAAVFFIACGNVASFVLGRAAARSRETSVRVALGAGRGQLARGLFADTVVISVAGGALGLLLAVWTSRALPVLLYEEDAARLVLAPALAGILTVCAVCVAITMACGLLPVLAIPYDRPAEVLRRESAGPSRAIRRLRAGLVVAQMASCCTLAVSTAVLLGGLRAALQTGAGQRAGRPILAGMHANRDWGLRHFREAERMVRKMPGVSWVEWAGRPPGGQPSWRSFRIEPQGLPLRAVTLDVAWLETDFLDRFELPPRAGRLFGFGDAGRRVAVVNVEAADVLFGAETPGRTVVDAGGGTTEIIGVVANRRRTGPTLYYDGPRQGRIAGATFRAAVRSDLARVELEVNVVSDGYFDAMGFPVVAGRLAGDGAAVVNREAADVYFGGNALGAAVIDDRGRRAGIVGVVHTAPLGAFRRQAEPAIYFPMGQDWLPRMTMIAGVRDAERMTTEIRKTLETVPGRGGDLIIVKTFETHLNQTALAPLRIATLLIGACAAAGLALGMIGLSGALSDAARQRRREAAVRIALGAHRRHMIAQVLREGGRLAAAGAAVGTAGSILLTRWLAGIAPGSGPPALWVWLSAPAALAMAVGVASVFPARGAVMADPVTILREDN
jgi:ABC-type antimicrobial peptide transport system permease subunit